MLLDKRQFINAQLCGEGGEKIGQGGGHLLGEDKRPAVGGIVSGVMGTLVGSVAPNLSSTSANMAVASVASVIGGISARGAEALLSAEEDEGEISEELNNVFALEDLAVDVVVGLSSGAMGSMAGIIAKSVKGGKVAVELATANIALPSNLLGRTVLGIFRGKSNVDNNPQVEDIHQPETEVDSNHDDGFNL